MQSSVARITDVPLQLVEDLELDDKARFVFDQALNDRRVVHALFFVIEYYPHVVGLGVHAKEFDKGWHDSTLPMPSGEDHYLLPLG